MNEGEVVCSHCKGTGWEYEWKRIPVFCSKCFGTGKLTWIENVFGKEKINYKGTNSTGPK